MRLLFLNLLAVSGYAVVIWPYDPIGAVVIEYLQLTQRQVQTLTDAQFSGTNALYFRRDALRQEIFDETAQSPLRPVELGRLYVEFETIRRRLVEIEIEQTAGARRLLTPEQLTKLRALEAAAALGDAITGARSLGLMASQCGPSQPVAYFLFPIPGRGLATRPASCDGAPFPLFSEIPVWGTRPTDIVDPISFTLPANLVRYLGLSDAQQRQIGVNQGVWDITQSSRIAQVQNEIQDETQRSTLNPRILGQLYAELETRRRILSIEYQQLQQRNLSVLSSEQRTKLAALEEAFRLRPTVDEAKSNLLIRTRCTQSFSVSFGGIPIGLAGSTIYLGDCPDARALEELP